LADFLSIFQIDSAPFLKFGAVWWHLAEKFEKVLIRATKVSKNREFYAVFKPIEKIIKNT
jgi:hypothetical protein